MKIVFYNLNHIGDTYFSQPCIQTFCQQNADQDISVFVMYNWYIFAEIPNLKIISETKNNYKNLTLNGCPNICNITDDTCLNLYSLLMHHKETSYFVFNDTLYINTWVAGNNFLTLCAECDVLVCHQNFKKMVHHLNYEYHLNLCYEINDSFLPVLPYVDIADFLDYRQYKKIITYYNYTPQSCQQFPNINHNVIIYNLSKLFPDYIILCAIKSDVDESNVICADMFGCEITPSCENNVKLCYIAMNSDYVFSFDIGACFFYLNSIFNSIFNGKWFHVGTSDKYFTKLNKYLKNPKVEFAYVDNEETFLSYIIQCQKLD
jgi:hypothetical protein